MGFEKQDLLLLVWVHGHVRFKGNEVTFESFPDRVAHLLRETHPTLRVESRVFPAYQTRGELTAATLAFVDWLTTLVVNLEVNHGAGGGAGKAKVVLMGHSMGGLLIADAALDIARNTRNSDPMWPKIVGIVAYDTPYLGLHPHVFKHGLSQAAGYYETARTVASNLAVLSPIAVGLGFGKWGSSSTSSTQPSQAQAQAQGQAGPSNPRHATPSKDKDKQAVLNSQSQSAPLGQAKSSAPASSSWWSAIAQPSKTSLYGLGAVALGAAAVGTAYYRREDFVNGWKFGYDHMTFVRNLWDEEGLRARLEGIERLGKERNVPFWNFYTYLPANTQHLVPRTFTIPPQPASTCWIPQTNSIAPDEVQAHMNMFSPKSNDGFYDLGLAVVRGVAERIEEEGIRAEGTADKEGMEREVEGEGDMERREKEQAQEDGRGRGNEGGEDDWEDGAKGGWREEKDEKGRTVLVEL